jgi:hypothetical protein
MVRGTLASGHCSYREIRENRQKSLPHCMSEIQDFFYLLLSIAIYRLQVTTFLMLAVVAISKLSEINGLLLNLIFQTTFIHFKLFHVFWIVV